jgi:hypothetical protein
MKLSACVQVKICPDSYVEITQPSCTAICGLVSDKLTILTFWQNTHSPLTIGRDTRIQHMGARIADSAATLICCISLSGEPEF